ncbi:MAG: DNA polymerase, partial [Candidatus Eremiobacterota bacterium]
VAAHQLDSVEGNFWLDEIGRKYGVDIPSESELLGRGPGSRRLSEVAADELTPWAGLRVLGLGRLAGILRERLAENDLLETFREVEMPMVWVAASMEKNGVGLDAGRLDDFSDHIDRLTRDIESEIFALAGQKFDLESPKDLADVLFDRMGLQVNARPKNGGGVGPELLVQVAEQSPVGNLIRDWRSLKELRAFYLEALPRLVHPRHGWLSRAGDHLVTSSERIQWMGPTLVGGAVATFNRLLAEVEELPNLELRSELRNHLLGALIPRDRKRTLVGVGYRELELRLAAHLSKEPALVKAFQKKQAADAQLATCVFGLESEGASLEQVKDAREVALGLAGTHRFARRMGISPTEATARLDRFSARFAEGYPQLKRFFDLQLEEVRTRGWVSSIESRRRPVPEVTSRNSDIRDTAERTARSAAIQASAADLMKTAMVQIFHRQQMGKLPGVLSMQLRDLLLFEVESRQKDTLAREVTRIMETVRQLDVPVTVEVYAGSNWANPKRLEAEAVGSKR